MLIFAHRGASGVAPENTLLAIDTALNMRAPAIELDIHLCEGEPIVIHDRRAERTTDGQGLIAQLSLIELQTFDAGAGQQVPTLWEALALISGRCILNLELKCEDCVEPVFQLLERAVSELHFQPNQFLISSFNHHLLKQWRQLTDRYLLGALTASCPISYAQFAENLGVDSVHVDLDVINQSMVNDARTRGLNIYVYTVDIPDDIRWLKGLGVDGIYTNYPDKAMAILSKLEHRID